MNGFADVSKMERTLTLQRQEQLSCKNSLVVALSDVDFGHHHSQTSRNMNSF
jgi:hypothetical protein